MNQDVLNIQDEMQSVTISDRLNWDWHNPLIAFPLATIGVLLAGATAVFLGLINAL
jgi:hypothetical protein